MSPRYRSQRACPAAGLRGLLIGTLLCLGTVAGPTGVVTSATVAAEPARFAPAGRVAPLPAAPTNELGLPSVVTASFLRLVDELDERSPAAAAPPRDDTAQAA
ncbi:MAG: hypothetical protein EBR86_09625, partial [Planctomycetia bacterium]|nr:hypothetical protein [Planctomycetia bacterium]